MAVQGKFEAIERIPGIGWVAKGWAVDAEAPDEPVRLVLTSEKGVLGEFQADLFRPELAAAGGSSGRHGFAVKLPGELLNGRPHLIRILVRKDGTALTRDGDEIFFPQHLHGQIDSVEHGALCGWVFDEHAPDRLSLLEIEIDGEHAAMVRCDQPRPDLAQHLASRGRHGFRFPLPASLFDNRPHRIAVRFANTDRQLVGSPVEIRLPAELLTTRRRLLDQLATERGVALEEGLAALVAEPLNRLNDPAAYRAWLEHHEAAIAAALAAVGGQVKTPTVAVIPLPGPEVGVADFAATVAGSAADAVVFLGPDTQLHPAFLPLAQAALAEDGVSLVYSDEDSQGADGGRVQPHFKPGWDPDRYQAFPYVGFACAIARDCLSQAIALVSEVDTPVDAWAWADAVVDTALLSVAPERIRHLPFVLYHRGLRSAVRLPRGGTKRAARVQAHLDRIGAPADAERDGEARVRVRWRLPTAPSPVTLIIPTRDRVDLLKACLESVLSKTTYPRYDIVIIDNDSREPATLAYLEGLARQPGVWVRRWPQPFNYAAMHNAVVEEISSPYVALLNNDVEVITPEWLEEMMGHAIRPEVGAVGAKLLYPDGMIQHGGVLVGQHGAADAAQRAFSRDEDGYFHSAMVVQAVSAVTAACMVCRRDEYLAVGGMDAERFSVAFNDVDFCLKLRARGRRILWTPHALLYHHESATRQTSRSPEAQAHEQQEVATLRAKWQTDCFIDPFYSPNLTRGLQTHVDFTWPLPPDPALERA
ncbi:MULTISPECIES: glycosyltransferase family 2 protein [unclassified Azospirillum]|uniref:glycosyltransferase family 2 protein n=1 Tax=unclassified Azospirillum TaxID=2630922 RepID=UPI000D659B17|nr:MULTISPECIES: glycosyltransferase family 2 protein [unclassified Azospirillum]